MLLSNGQIDILSVSVLKEVAQVIIDLRSLPAAQTTPCILGVVVLASAATTRSCGTAKSVIGILGKVNDLGTPSHGASWVVTRYSAVTILIKVVTLSIHVLTLKLA